VTRFGLFVMLRESGGSGIVPISSLPSDYYDHDEHRHSLVGRRWGRVYRLGETVAVRLVEAKPITGGLTLQLIEDEAAADERIMAATPAVGRPRQRAAGRSQAKRPHQRGPRRSRRGANR
jgi:ribonuclease R